MDPETALLEAEEAMDKAVDHLKHELRGLRTGRASPALVEYVKIEAYGGESELRSLARISVPEATQLLIKPYDKGTISAIVKGIEKAGLGLNPMSEGDSIRINLPAMSGDRRQQLVNEAKKYGEETKIKLRNARRDANKTIDTAGQDKSQSLSEDDVKSAKDDVQELLKTYEGKVDEVVQLKSDEILAV